MLQPSCQFYGSPLDLLYHFHVLLLFGVPEPDLALQVGSQSAVKGHNHLLQPAGHVLFDANPRIWLSFWAVSKHCWLIFSFSPTIIPYMYFFASVCVFQSCKNPHLHASISQRCNCLFYHQLNRLRIANEK